MPSHGLYINLLSFLLLLFASCTGCSKDNTKDNSSISLQTSAIDMPAEKSSRSLEVTASGAWSTESDQTWCKAAKAGDLLLVIAEANDTKAARTATVTVKCGDASDALTVNQAAAASNLTVSPSELILNAAPSANTLKITSDAKWSISCPAEWVTITPASGNGNADVTVSTQQNHKDELRGTDITVTCTDEITDEGKTVVVKLSQRAVLPQIELSEKQLAFDHTAGTKTVTIDVTGQWQAQLPQDCTWLQVAPESGVSGKHEISVTATENESKTQERKASIRFNAPVNKFAILNVTQEATPKVDFTVTLMDYNTHNCIGMDDIYDAFRISKVLSGFKADCIALQELDSVTQRPKTKERYVLGEIAKYLSTKSVFYPALDSYQGGKYGIGMLSKTEPVSWYGIKIPYTDEQRGALMVEFENFWYICTHFDAGVEKRLEAAKLITEHAKTLSKDKPVFLAGDLNAKPGEDCIRYLREHFTPLSNTMQSTVVGSSSSCIDYIFIYKTVGGNPVKYEVLETQTVTTALAEQASDHYPLMVKVRITE